MRPGATCETSRVPRAPDCSLDDDRDCVFGGDRSVRGALGEHRPLRRRDARDSVAADELDEVDEVRSDVGERARPTAQGGIDAPVVVADAEQPVLQVRTR